MRTLFQEQLRQAHPELFRQVPAQVWRRHWNVDSRPAGSGENALRYLARYVFKTATGNRPVKVRANRVRALLREETAADPRGKANVESSVGADPSASATGRLSSSLHPALSPLPARHEAPRLLAAGQAPLLPRPPP